MWMTDYTDASSAPQAKKIETAHQIIIFFVYFWSLNISESKHVGVVTSLVPMDRGRVVTCVVTSLRLFSIFWPRGALSPLQVTTPPHFRDLLVFVVTS